MRGRQLASSVRNGRKIMFTILDENPIAGYLAGWDEEAYLVLYEDDDDGELYKEIISKNNILKITLFDEKTFRDENHYKEMEAIVRPFRDFLNSPNYKNDD